MKKLLLPFLLILGLATAFAHPVFLALGGQSGRDPADYGFAVTRATQGDTLIVTVSLNAAATAAFKEAEILVLGDLNMDQKKNVLPKVAVATVKELKVITVTAPVSTVIRDYALHIVSAPIPNTADTPSHDFAGYSFRLDGPP